MTKTEAVIIIRENPSSAVAAFTLGGLAAEELLVKYPNKDNFDNILQIQIKNLENGYKAILNERIIKKLEELGGKENDKKRMEG